jgi:hypothetical protein
MVHANYDYGPGFDPEFRFESGQRADAINFETREILELKPNNPAAIARGERQLANYISQANSEFPKGPTFTGKVITYARP